jgi:hypothetical protein
MNKPWVGILLLTAALASCTASKSPPSPSSTPVPTAKLDLAQMMERKILVRNALERSMYRPDLLPPGYVLEGPYSLADEIHPQNPIPSVFVGYAVENLMNSSELTTIYAWYFLNSEDAVKMWESLLKSENLPWKKAQKMPSGDAITYSFFGDLIGAMLEMKDNGNYIVEVISISDRQILFSQVLSKYGLPVMKDIHTSMSVFH